MTPGACFRTLLGSVSAQLAESLANQDLPFDVLVDRMQPSRSLSHHPVFQAVLMLEAEQREIVLGPMRISPVEIETGFTKFDLTLVLRAAGSDASRAISN